SSERPLERWMLPFVVFTRILGLPGLSTRVSEWIRRRMIRPKQRFDAALHRSIEVRDDAVSIRDELRSPVAASIVSLRRAVEIPMHSPSARTDANVEISNDADQRMMGLLEDLRRSGRAVVEFNVPLA